MGRWKDSKEGKDHKDKDGKEFQERTKDGREKDREGDRSLSSKAFDEEQLAGDLVDIYNTNVLFDKL